MGDVLLSLAAGDSTAEEEEHARIQLLRDYADGVFLGAETASPSGLVALHHDF